ncbi:Nitrogen regulatory protein [Legionella birminghamensis]|uniref:Nitrogen regulatory protein n=1 Tax=Legionella birminghamensis TaxID=28083 RepID=A0A378ICJ0_9GAMM|nr:PTS sugar transporter subunit IIA [Legionella birminghamensis]KTC75497.1 Nitrogen regulatory protein [Legionella birminghamensis]STX32723.1 Nitrogen regulatory protein [Legionella birminghamensis]
MFLAQIITPDCVNVDSSSKSKAAVFQKVSQLLSDNFSELNREELFSAYWKREALGSTAIGHGIAIPHVRVPGLNRVRACFIRLLHPVDFCAEDRQLSDLIIALAVPENQSEYHLKLLREIIVQFSDQEFCRICRGLTCEKALFNLLIEASNTPGSNVDNSFIAIESL